MPAKQEQRAEINTFVQGLITEASPLNFPENAEADGENFELNRDGSRNRRFGMDIEEGGVFRDTGIQVLDLSEAGINTFKWTEVAGDPRTEILVVQFNQKLDFYDLAKNNTSSDGYLGNVVLSSFPTNTKFSFSSVEGILVAVAGVDTFAIISADNGVFSVTYDSIKIRDLFGVEETITEYEEDMSYRGALNIEHYYNLQNQSWGIPRSAKITYGGGSYFQYADPVASYLQHFGFAPSNGESVWLGMQFSPGQYNQVSQQNDDPNEILHVNLFRETWGSEVKTTRGYYVIDALRRGQSRTAEMHKNWNKYQALNYNPATGGPLVPNYNLPADFSTGGASCVAEYSGRIFYSGFTGEVVDGDNRSPNYTNYVFFSQLVKNKLDLSKCYQDGDPTGRETADILDTDGGFLRISEAKNIHTLVNMGTGLLVIAENGVWRIDGGSDYGFSATNYRVEKISSFGGISNSSVVLENNRVYYWAEDGIYTVGSNEFGDMSADSISAGSIQTFYQQIPNIAKRRATSMYDSISKKVRWVVNYEELMSANNTTREIILDTTLGSFSVNRIMNLPFNSVTVHSLFQTAPYITGVAEEEVLAGSDAVFADSELVSVNTYTLVSGIQSVKYLALRRVENDIHYSFSLYRNTNFKDWEDIDGNGVDAKAFCLTGHQIVGDSAVKKQIPYLVIHFLRTETFADINGVPQNQSGCLFRGQWNFANTAVSKNWTPLMQAYKYRKAHLASSPLEVFDNGYEVITSKNKLRGSGRAFALYFETEEGKDCRLLGWNITMTGNSVT